MEAVFHARPDSWGDSLKFNPYIGIIRGRWFQFRSNPTSKFVWMILYGFIRRIMWLQWEMGIEVRNHSDLISPKWLYDKSNFQLADLVTYSNAARFRTTQLINMWCSQVSGFPHMKWYPRYGPISNLICFLFFTFAMFEDGSRHLSAVTWGSFFGFI